MSKVRAFLNWLPHWVFVGLSIGAGAFGQALYDMIVNGAGLPTTQAAILGDLRTGLAAGVAALIGYLKTDPWTTSDLKAGRLSQASASASAAKIAAFLFLSGSLFALGAPVQACTPAQQAEFSQVTQLVLNDLKAGKQLAQIEADVATAVAGQPGADVVMIVDDALALLIDLGVIPQNLIPQAVAMRVAEAEKLATKGLRPAGAAK